MTQYTVDEQARTAYDKHCALEAVRGALFAGALLGVLVLASTRALPALAQASLGRAAYLGLLVAGTLVLLTSFTISCGLYIRAALRRRAAHRNQLMRPLFDKLEADSGVRFAACDYFRERGLQAAGRRWSPVTGLVGGVEHTFRLTFEGEQVALERIDTPRSGDLPPGTVAGQ